jgi:hypothetical protein
VTVGILLTVTLAVIFFPLYGIIMLISNILNHRATFVEQPPVAPIEPTMENKNGNV